MNVLVINLDKAIFSPSSASRRRLEQYSRFLNKLFVIVWTREKFKPIDFQGKLFIYPTNSRFKIFYYLDSFLLARKIIKRDKIDLLFTQDPFETGFCGWLVARIFKIPLQFQIHTDIFSPYFWQESFLNKIRVLLAKFLIPKADCLRVVSERIKRSLLSPKPYTLKPITVLPIFVDVKKIQETPIIVGLRQKYPQFDFIILMASRLTREKNISLAIRAMAEVVKKYPKTGLVIIGEGLEKKRLMFQVSSFKLQDNIILEGWIPFDKLISYYKTADLFLLTSNYEGYGMSVLEAMASGCPVIMTDVGLAGEVLNNGKEGLVAPVGNAEKLSRAILLLMEEKVLRERLKTAALEKIKGLGSREEYLENYKTMLLNCR